MKHTHPLHTGKRSSYMSGWLDDKISDLKSSVESSVKAVAQDILPESLYEDASQMIASKRDDWTAKATTMAMTEVQKYVAQPEVQDKAAESFFYSVADSTNKYYKSNMDLLRIGGPLAVMKANPITSSVIGGSALLLLVRFALGGRKKVYYGGAAPIAANPKKRKSKRKSRR